MQFVVNGPVRDALDEFEFFILHDANCADHVFEARLARLRGGALVLPPRFAASMFNDASDTPITSLLTRGMLSPERELGVLRVLHEELGFSVDECAEPGGGSPLALAATRSLFGLLSVRYLLERGALMRAAARGNGVLYSVVFTSCCEEMLELLAQRPPPALVEEARVRRFANVQGCGHRAGVSVLHLAVYRMRPRMVRLLVERFGADTEARDSADATPLDWIPLVLVDPEVKVRSFDAHLRPVRTCFFGEEPPLPSVAERADAIGRFLLARDAQYAAFLMAGHPRLGARSEAGQLPPECLHAIAAARMGIRPAVAPSADFEQKGVAATLRDDPHLRARHDRDILNQIVHSAQRASPHDQRPLHNPFSDPDSRYDPRAQAELARIAAACGARIGAGPHIAPRAHNP